MHSPYFSLKFYSAGKVRDKSRQQQQLPDMRSVNSRKTGLYIQIWHQTWGKLELYCSTKMTVHANVPRTHLRGCEVITDVNKQYLMWNNDDALNHFSFLVVLSRVLPFRLTLLSLRAFVIQKVALKHTYCVGIVPVSCCCCLTAFTRWRTMSLTGHFTFLPWSFALEFNLWHFINIAPGLIDPLLFLGHYFEDLHTCTWSTHKGPMMTAMSGGHY